ncbi:MAG: methylated-DNA--[protein]-cysteine S-methyltransferase [Gammaproteobacteria bacterium]|nr:methylated-DNA--[protein]-cysteine S-methyltransferase [Gammaproteobacteria bacterium]
MIFKTLLGDMLAVSDEQYLYLLKFTQNLPQQKNSPPLLEAETGPLVSIQHGLDAYFNKRLKTFTTPFKLNGTAFQQKAWRALCEIPYAETRSYKEQADMLEQPKAFHAVANANRMNPLPILVPCHRVIRANHTLGGYASGIHKKQWLLSHEQTQQEI